MAKKKKKSKYPEPPEHFDEYGISAWNKCCEILMEAHGSVEIFVHQLEVVCWEFQCWKYHQIAMISKKDDGISIAPATGYEQMSARSNLMSRHFTSFQTGCKNLGITPSFITRNKLIAKDEDKKDEFEDFKNS